MTPDKYNFNRQPLGYYLDFLGCRLNAAEIEDLARRIVGAGGEIVTRPEAANVIVLNTCSVTAQAAQRSLRRLKKLHQLQPNADIAVLGCWATEDVKRAKRLSGVKWVLPNSDKSRSVGIITGVESQPAPWVPGRWGHTRAFLAVQDGCDHHCTYCLTQVLRGPARSRPLAEAVNDVQDLVSAGAQEVVLTGVSLGAYGIDFDFEDGLSILVDAILQDTAVPRLRLSSIEPWDVTDTLLGHWENPRLCRQLHLPLQSGSDAVLHRMGRHITAEHFALLVKNAREYSPEIAITTDVMVGFPGESESEFEQTLKFIKDLNFSRLHVFPYSERPGTAAAKMKGGVPKIIRKARADQLRVLNNNLRFTYRERMLGQTLPVLYQKRVQTNLWMGLTDTYVKVLTESSQDIYNNIIDTVIVSNKSDHVTGKIPVSKDIEE